MSTEFGQLPSFSGQQFNDFRQVLIRCWILWPTSAEADIWQARTAYKQPGFIRPFYDATTGTAPLVDSRRGNSRIDLRHPRELAPIFSVSYVGGQQSNKNL